MELNNYLKAAAVITAITLGGASASHAAVVSVSGGVSSAGSAPAIIAAPGDATPFGAFNTAIQAFDEQQAYTLTNDLVVDGGIIPAGEVVSSQMIFLNSEDGTPIAHGTSFNTNFVSFTFDGMILGVMSDRRGILETSSQFLGAAGTLYPAGPLRARGMEMNPQVANSDFYAVAGNTITVGMGVRDPGDWIRVVTVSQVPLPGSFLLLGSALAGLVTVSRRRRSPA